MNLTRLSPRVSLFVAVAGFSLCFFFATRAHAGGLELPDSGAEALGRGAAFTAKADDGTAFIYNIAGFARQRGTRLYLGGNVVFHDYEFQRSGVYPDMNTAQTPWGGQPFPRVRDTGPPFFAPLFALSTDFGYFDRWTFAIGAYGPSAVGNRTYPLGVAGFPAPSRYDVVQPNALVVYPSLAIAVRITHWLDFGVALHVVVGNFNLTSTSFTDLSQNVCPNPEYQPCDALNTLHVTGVTATASAGLLARPSRWFAFGVNVRGPFTIDASGTVNATPPAILNMMIAPAPATFHTSFPWVVRAGARFIWVRDRFEQLDLEADASYESWGSAQGGGPQVEIPSLSIFTDLHPQIVHHYHDTFSVRVGGAVNVRLPAGVLSLRAGTFYDSSATNNADTRLDFDTLAKIGATAGIGYHVRGFNLDIGYAHVFEASRDVTDGDIRPINGAANGTSMSATGQLLPAVNNGHYSARTDIVALSISFNWETMLKREHPVHYAADYEPYAPPPAPPRKAPPPVEESPPTDESAPPPATEERESDTPDPNAIDAPPAPRKKKKRKHH